MVPVIQYVSFSICAIVVFWDACLTPSFEVLYNFFLRCLLYILVAGVPLTHLHHKFNLQHQIILPAMGIVENTQL